MKTALPALAGVVLAVSGCASQRVSFDGTFTTPAEQRMVLRTTRPGPDGKSPVEVTCAEPSPDIAKLLSESSKTDVGGGVGLPNGLGVNAAYGAAKAKSEGLAQLTERLATIQILRDSMYRACEAYANQAIDRTGYALVLAHSERLILGLLVSELISNRRAASPIVIGANADLEGDEETAAALIQLPNVQQALSGTLQQIGKLTGRAVDVTNLDAIAAQPEAKQNAPLRKLLGEALGLKGQVFELQNKLLSGGGLGRVLNLAKLPGLAGGTPAAPAKPRRGGSKAGPAPAANPVSSAAVMASADASVEIVRINALLDLMRLLTQSAGPSQVDGIQVACMTALSPGSNVDPMVKDQCLNALQRILYSKLGQPEKPDAPTSRTSGTAPAAPPRAALSAIRVDPKAGVAVSQVASAPGRN